MRKKVVCFDLDDTLYKEQEFLYSGFRKVAELVESRCDAKDVFNRLCQIRKDGKKPFDVLEEELGGAVSKNELLRTYREHKPTIYLNDGVEQLLKTLKDRGCILGLITDGRSSTQRNKIDALRLGRWFNECDIVISEEFGSEKPDERNYRYFEISHPGCRYYYVGDNADKDFIAPNRLGWDTIGINDCLNRNIHKSSFDRADPEHRPSVVVDSFYELSSVILLPHEREFI